MTSRMNSNAEKARLSLKSETENDPEKVGAKSFPVKKRINAMSTRTTENPNLIGETLGERVKHRRDKHLSTISRINATDIETPSANKKSSVKYSTLGLRSSSTLKENREKISKNLDHDTSQNDHYLSSTRDLEESNFDTLSTLSFCDDEISKSDSRANMKDNLDQDLLMEENKFPVEEISVLNNNSVDEDTDAQFADDSKEALEQLSTTSGAVHYRKDTQPYQKETSIEKQMAFQKLRVKLKSSKNETGTFKSAAGPLVLSTSPQFDTEFHGNIHTPNKGQALTPSSMLATKRNLRLKIKLGKSCEESVTKKVLDDETLTPELKELARIMGSSRNQRTRKWDWNYIEKKASKNLRAYISSKKKYNSFRITPMRIVVSDAKTPAFLAYCDKVRNELSSTLDAKEMQRGRVTVENKASEEKTHVRTTAANNGKARKQNCEDKAGYTFGGIDYSSLLPMELLELGKIMETQEHRKKSRVKWDWDYIDSKASKRLQKFLRIKKKSPYFRITPMRIVVGDEMTQHFLAYRKNIKGRKSTKRQGDQVPVSSVTRSKRTRSEEQILQPAPILETLSEECMQLAKLLAKAKRGGQTWADVESMASAKLKAYIKAKAKAPNFLMNPVRCLVPSKSFSDFQVYTERCFEQCLDENEGQDQLGNLENDKDLGKIFALERRDKITEFAKALRAEVHSFESRELALWNSFLGK